MSPDTKEEHGFDYRDKSFTSEAHDDGNKGNILYLGIDLGTYRSAIVGSNGIKKTLRSVVGWPKDAIAMKLIQDSVLFGEDVLNKRLSLDFCFPLEKGVIKKNSEKHMGGARELLTHIVNLAEPNGYDKIYGVIGAPAKATTIDKQTIVDLMGDLLDAVMVVSEPFTVAYGFNLLNHTLVIDMGAGTIDLCRMHGTIPDDEDQATINKAGDYVDQQLLKMLKGKYTDANLNMYMVQKYKEEFASVTPEQDILVEFPVNGKSETRSIKDEMKKACESIVPDTVNAIKDLVATFDPEFQQDIKNNIMLAGGLSQIKGLDKFIEDGLEQIGGGKVTTVSDHLFAGAAGALKLAQDMPHEYWKELV